MTTPEPTPEQVAAAAAEVERAADDVASTHLLEANLLTTIRRLRDAGHTVESSPTLMLLDDVHTVFRYDLQVELESAQFHPEWVAGNEVHPKLPADQPPERIRRWLALREAAGNVLVRARLGHVALESGQLFGRARVDLAEAVAGDYLAFASSPLPTGDDPSIAGGVLDRVDAVRVAAGLARQFGRTELRAQALAEAADMAARILAVDSRSPGAVLRLTQYLIHHDDGDAVDALLVRARAAYHDDVHNLGDVIHQQIERAHDEAARRALFEELVQAWLAAADAADPLVGMVWRQQAVEVAEESGDSELRRLAVAALQEGGHAGMEMAGLRAGIVRTESDVAEALMDILKQDDWRDALDMWAVFGPLTGSVESNRAWVAHQMTHSISALVTQTIVGGDRLPRYTASSESERAEYLLARQEMFLLEMSQYLVFEGLTRIVAKFGIPTGEELAEYFARHPVIGPRRAAALARAFLRWWAGDLEGAALTALPRIEGLARDLLLAINVPLYRLQRQSRPGQYPGLGFLLDELRKAEVVSESRFRFMHTLLAHPAGWNARNEISHGFIDDLVPAMSALILQIAAYLTVVPLLLAQQPDKDDANPERDDESGAATTPTPVECDGDSDGDTAATVIEPPEHSSDETHPTDADKTEPS